MRFSPRFLDELRERIPLGDLVGRKVKLTRAGRELKGLCPFHNEKTPSFHIVEDKNFYHCFGCGAHGDAIAWLMEHDGLSFPEAVEEMAALAGLPLPAPDPEEKKRSEQAAGLYDVLETATRWFQQQLGNAQGRKARAYLKDRGLSPETIQTFRLGFAPDNYDSLRDALTVQGITTNQLVEAGLLKSSDRGGQPFSYFRNRIIFPITDRQGRIIAFGGRSLEKDNPAKYLNSPDTPLFHKGRTLYNLVQARKAAHDARAIAVVEGYMDVIALAQAGIGHAVAPLGTALTREQIEALWRMSPEPILCFDGDRAGLGAAHRAADRALPLLKAGRSLRFALLPDGLDPDDLVRREGRSAMDAILDRAIPLSDLLWQGLTQNADISTPERRAGLERAVHDKLREITDETVRGFYIRAFRQRLYDIFSPRRFRMRRRSVRDRSYDVQSKNRDMAPPTAELLATRLARPGMDEDRQLFEQLICLYVINHPHIAERHAEELAALDFTDSMLDKLRQELLVTLNAGTGLDPEALKAHLAEDGFKEVVARLMHSPLLRPAWSAWPDATADEAEIGWRHVMARLRRLALKNDIAAMEMAYRKTGSDETLRRLIQLRQEYNQAEGTEAELDGYVFRSL